MTTASSTRYSDRALRETVLAAVTWVAPENSDVDVVVHDGNVTACGSVRCIADRDRVLAAAMDAPGVQVVVDHLVVRSVHGPEASDGVTAAQIRTLIASMPSIHVGGVRIRVRRGVVTVSGEIPWPFERDTLVNLIGAVSGVEDVVDLLAVRRTDNADQIATARGVGPR